MQVPFVSCVSQMVATVSSQQTVVGNKQNICTNYSVMWTEVFFDRTCNRLQSCRTKRKRLSSYKKVFWRGLSSCGYTPPPTQAMQLKSLLSVMLMDQYWSWHVEWEGGSLQTYTATLYFLLEMSVETDLSDLSPKEKKGNKKGKTHVQAGYAFPQVMSRTWGLVWSVHNVKTRPQTLIPNCLIL